MAGSMLFVHVPGVFARAGIVHDPQTATLTLLPAVARGLGVAERVAWAPDGEVRIFRTHPRYHLALVLHEGGVRSTEIDQLLAEHAEHRHARNAAFLAQRAEGYQQLYRATAETGRYGPGDLAPQLDAAIDLHGLQPYRERLHRLCLRAVSFRAGTPGPVPLGASRLGGAPDLPPGTAWPRAGGDGGLLGFVAQIDIASLPLAHTLPLPRDGHLLLFHGQTLDMWDRGLVWYVPPGPLVRTLPPSGVPWNDEEGGLYGEASVVFAPALSLPSGGALAFEALELESPASPSYFDLRRHLTGEWPSSVLGGYMGCVQHDHLREIVFAQHGHPDVWIDTAAGIDDLVATADELGQDFARADAARRLSAYRWLMAEPSRRGDFVREMLGWVCLLDLAPHDEIGMHLSDSGRLQFMLRYDDLAALRFDRLECRLA